MLENAHFIDLDTYPRRDHFRYFCSMAYPYVGCTVNVDITDFLSRARMEKQPFFLSFLYHAVCAANSVPELRRRIYEDRIIEFDCCGSSHTVAKADGTYCYCPLRFDMSFEDFLPYAIERHEAAKESGTLEEDKDILSCYFVSSVPWLSYTCLIQPVPSPADSNPRINWGKYFQQDGRTLMPVSILCHHGLVDGLHLGQFYTALEKRINA